MEKVEDRPLICLKLDLIDKGNICVWSCWTSYGFKKDFVLASKNIL